MTAATFPLASSLRQSDALVGDGVTTLFGPFNFRTFAPEDIGVLMKEAGDLRFSLLDSGYVVLPIDNPDDPQDWNLFYVRFSVAPASTTQFYVQGMRNQNRSMAVRKANQIDTDAIDKQLSQIGVVQQEQSRELGYAVKTDRGIDPLTIIDEPEAGDTLIAGGDGTLRTGPNATDLMAVATRAQQYADAAAAARDAIAVPTINATLFTGAGSGPYDLGRTILSAAALQVYLNNEILLPGEVTVSGHTFTLVGYAPTSDDKILVIDTTPISIGKPSGNSVDDNSLDPTSFIGKFAASAPNLLGAFGIEDDGTDQTAKFPALVARAAGGVVDFGQKFPAGDWPEGIRIENGGMTMAGALVPGQNTLRMEGFRLTRSNSYDKWAQDKAHVLPRGVLCCVYVSGSGHHSADNMVVCKFSHDGGASWSARKVLIAPETELQSTQTGNGNDKLACMSAGCTNDGRQFLLWMTYELSGHRHFLWHRKAPDHRKISCTVQTFIGESRLRIAYAGHGYYAGDPVTLPALVCGGNDIGAAGAINGLTKPGGGLSNLLVTAADTGWFEVTLNGTASASQAGIATTATLQNGWGPFVKTEISSALQTAYLALWPSLPGAGLPYLHGRMIADNGDIIAFLSTANGAHLVRIASLYSVAPTVTKIPNIGQGGEVTGVACGSGRYAGFTRGTDVTGTSDGRSLFWRTDDNFATTTVEEVRPDDSHGGQIWDEITPICLCNGKLMAARAERTDDPLDSQPAQPASCRLYLWEADVDDAFAIGINAAKFEEIARLHWSGAKTAQSSPGVGVGSWAVHTPPPDAINNAMTGLSPNKQTAYLFIGCEIENQTGKDGDWNRGQLNVIRFTDLAQPQRAIQDGGGVSVGGTDDMFLRELASGELGSGFAASTGAYIGSPPSSPVDLTTSPDYKGGGIRLYKDKTGFVHCFGSLDYSGPINTEAIAFVLDEDWRPRYDVEWIVSAGAATIARTGGTNLVVRILGSNNISASDRGACHVSRQGNVGMAATITNIRFDGLMWPAEGDAR